MAEFALKNIFESNVTVQAQISGTAIRTKCASSYVYIFMSKFETVSSRVSKIKLYYGFDTVMISFSSGHMGKTHQN